MHRRLRDERGIALITALMVSMVVLTISIAVVAVSIHNSTQSSRDRKRIQSIDVAEAGIDAYYSSLTTATGSALCNDIDADMPEVPGAHYHVSIKLYSTWPPVPGTELSCPPTVQPLGAVVTSKGTAVSTSSPVAVNRTMEAAVKLTPIYGGFGQAIFSDKVLNFQNQFTLNGHQANDGDVYTNGDFILRNNTTIAGSVYAQGGADIQSGVIKQDVWANKGVSLQSISVFGKVTSSLAGYDVSITNSSHVFSNVKSGRSITVSANSQVDGTRTPNSPSGPPPAISLPALPWDPTAWQCSDCTPPTNYTEPPAFTDCTVARTFINTIVSGDYAIHVSPACAGGLLWTGNTTVNVRGNLAIFVDGAAGSCAGTPCPAIATQNNVTFQGVGGPWTIFLIVPTQTGLTCGSGASNYDISVANSTQFNNLQLFVYSPCTVNFGNNNATGVNGQIIGGTVNITNQMVMNYVPITVPKLNIVGYNVQPSYLREITNS